MIGFISLSLPVFTMVGLGWLATRMRWTSPAALDGLGAFSFRFALPALVVRLIASAPIGQSFDPAFFAGYLASGATVFLLMFGISRWANSLSLPLASARATSSSVSNLGFLGPPLVIAFFGQRGAGPLAMAIVVEVGILMPIGAAIMAGPVQGRGSVFRSIARSTVYNPIVLAIMIGALIALSGAALPGPLDRFLSLLGASAAPTALFAVGGALAMQKITRATSVIAFGISAMKLVVYPIIAWCILAQLLRLGSFWSGTGILISALPSAGSNYVLAQRYEVDADNVSAAIVISTIASMLTVPMVAWLVSG